MNMPDTPPSPFPLPPSSAEADLSGRQLGDFHLLRRLGRGAMADVYLAEQERLKRRVAVKILKPELAGDRTYLQRFELEAQAAASLVHANIVQIYEVGCVEQLHYIAQEYVQGQNLREYIARHGPPDLPHALSIMRQVAAALAKAAEQGVVHRDIKPENIMLTAGGEVKVADFGLARLTREGAANDLTQVGITLGTPLYMSPEQVEGKPLDPRSDIYSFGVTCYHMLAGAPPFRGETALGVAVQHLKKQPQPLESLRRRPAARPVPDRPSDVGEGPVAAFCHGARPAPRAAPRADRALRRRLAGRPARLGLAGRRNAADLRVAATQRLGGLMKTMARRGPAPRPGMAGRRTDRRVCTGRRRRLVHRLAAVALGRRQVGRAGHPEADRRLAAMVSRQPDRHGSRLAERHRLLSREDKYLYAPRRTATGVDLSAQRGLRSGHDDLREAGQAGQRPPSSGRSVWPGKCGVLSLRKRVPRVERRSTVSSCPSATN